MNEETYSWTVTKVPRQDGTLIWESCGESVDVFAFARECRGRLGLRERL